MSLVYNLPTQLYFTVCENEGTATAVAVWWQWRTSVFARSAAVVWDWLGKTTSQCPACSRCPCESTHSQGCLWAWREFGPQSRQQQSFIDNSTKRLVTVGPWLGQNYCCCFLGCLYSTGPVPYHSWKHNCAHFGWFELSTHRHNGLDSFSRLNFSHILRNNFEVTEYFHFTIGNSL